MNLNLKNGKIEKEESDLSDTVSENEHSAFVNSSHIMLFEKSHLTVDKKLEHLSSM